MITALELQNFKGIAARQRIDFAPLTLLFGANSAGKSSILQALLFPFPDLDDEIESACLELTVRSCPMTTFRGQILEGAIISVITCYSSHGGKVGIEEDAQHAQRGNESSRPSSWASITSS